MDISGNMQGQVSLMSNILIILLEKVCEAIYFSLFLIYGKNIKEKRLLFICIMIAEYLMITKLIEYNIWIHISYIALTYINLKVLYKEKAQITDIFLFASASIILILFSGIFAILVYNNLLNYIIALILLRTCLFLFLILNMKNINGLYKAFWKRWNRNKTSKIKSLTLRNISIIIFNLMFYSINLAMIICNIIIERR